MKYVTKTLAEIFPNLSKNPMSAYVDGEPLPVRLGDLECKIIAARVVGRGKNKGKIHIVLLPEKHVRIRHFFLDPGVKYEVQVQE